MENKSLIFKWSFPTYGEGYDTFVDFTKAFKLQMDKDEDFKKSVESIVSLGLISLSIEKPMDKTVAIEDLDFSVRAYNGLKGKKINRLIDISRFTMDEVLGWRGFGPSSLKELETEMVRLCVNFKPKDL